MGVTACQAVSSLTSSYTAWHYRRHRLLLKLPMTLDEIAAPIDVFMISRVDIIDQLGAVDECRRRFCRCSKVATHCISRGLAP